MDRISETLDVMRGGPPPSLREITTRYETQKRKPSENFIENLYDAIFNATGITREQIESPIRKREITIPRQIFCCFVRLETEMSLKQVGMLVNRDHATVIHSKNVLKDLYPTNRSYRTIVNDIALQLNNDTINEWLKQIS